MEPDCLLHEIEIGIKRREKIITDEMIFLEGFTKNSVFYENDIQIGKAFYPSTVEASESKEGEGSDERRALWRVWQFIYV